MYLPSAPASWPPSRPAVGRAEPPPPARAAVLDPTPCPSSPPPAARIICASCCRRRRAPSPSAPSGSWGWAAALDTPRRPRRARSRSAPAGAARAAASMPATSRWSGPAARAARPRCGTRCWPPGRAGPWCRTSRFLWQGPAAARGAYLWAHGRAAGGQDSRGGQPQPHVRIFNNAGYDVLRFDRAPATDETEAAAAWLRRGFVRTARAGLCADRRRRPVARRLERLAGAGSAGAGGRGGGHRAGRAWRQRQRRPGPGRSTTCGRLSEWRAARSPGSPWRTSPVTNSTPTRSGRARIFREPVRTAPCRRPALPRPAAGVWKATAAGADARFTQRYGACLLEFVEGRSSRC